MGVMIIKPNRNLIPESGIRLRFGLLVPLYLSDKFVELGLEHTELLQPGNTPHRLAVFEDI